MWRNLSVAAVVICVIGASIARADIIVTLDGDNLTDIITLANYPGQFIMAVEGNTPFEPNHISVEAVNGTLELVGDGNESYYFQFVAEGEAAVNLITKVDMVIDGVSVPADTLIYQLWMYYNPNANIYAAYGIGLSDLFIPPEEEQGQPIAEQPVEQSGISTEESPSETQSQPVNDCNSLPMTAVRQEKRKVLLNCPNSVDEIPFVRAAREKPEFFAMSDDSGGLMLLDGVVEVSSDITTNQIWTADNTYHITAGINVQALLVIEPGTIIEFASGTWMAVNNGGTLISAGTPDNPIIYTSDSTEPGYSDYSCAILIEETASASTRITYNYIEYAEYGIWVMNNRLDSPIENNYLYNNTFGILEYGIEHTDIYNNLIYASYYNAIEINMESYEGQADAGSHILIQNNTCDYYQDVGILVYGVPTSGDAGEVTLSNNIVSGAYQYGIVLANGYMYYTLINTGYYDNAVDKYDNYDEINPVIETEMPYVNGTGTLPICYLNPNSAFVNASDEYIEQTRLIGKTTDINNFPDSNKADLGFHYPNWNYSNAGDGNSLPMDLNADLIVNFEDFAILAAGWQITYDIGDLNVMADEWLKTAGTPIAVIISGDSNTGYVNIDVSGCLSDIMQTYFYVDGQYMGEHTDLDISALGSGMHELKAVSIDINDRIICSNLLQTSFSCPFNYCNSYDAYELNEPYYFHAFYQGSGSVTVSVFDEDQNLAWSQTYPAENINGFVPPEITTREDLHTIVFTHSSGGSSMMSLEGMISDLVNDEHPLTKPCVLSFNPKNVNAGVRALIVALNQGSYDASSTTAVKNTYRSGSVPFHELIGSQATSANLGWFAQKRQIQFIYYTGHGNFEVEGPPHVYRTVIKLNDGPCFSVRRSDYPNPAQAPAWCVELPRNYETASNASFAQMGWNSLKFAFFDCCWAGKNIIQGGAIIPGPSNNSGIPNSYTNDMYWALNLQAGDVGCYQSWDCNAVHGGNSSFDKFVRNEYDQWAQLRSLYSAIQDSISKSTPDPTTYDDPAEHYAVYGHGDLISLQCR